MSTTVRFEHNGIPLEVTGEVIITKGAMEDGDDIQVTVDTIHFDDNKQWLEPNATRGLAEACEVALVDEYKRWM